MEIKGKLENQDIINYNLYHFRHSKSIQKRAKIVSVVGPVLFGIGTFIAYKTTNIPLWFWAGIFVIASIVWYQSYPKRLEFALTRNVSKMLEEGDNDGMMDESVITLDEDGLSKVNSKKEIRIKWSSVSKIAYDGENIFIYDTSISALIIKDDMFDSKEHKKEFVNMLNKFYKE